MTEVQAAQTAIITIAFSPGGASFAIATVFGGITIYELQNELIYSKIREGERYSKEEVALCFDKTGGRIYAKFTDPRGVAVEIWDVNPTVKNNETNGTDKKPILLSRSGGGLIIPFPGSDYVVCKGWVLKGGKRLCWIPPRLVDYSVIVHDNRIVTGGRGTIVRVDLSKVV